MCLFCRCSFWISPDSPPLPIHSPLDSGIKNLDPQWFCMWSYSVWDGPLQNSQWLAPSTCYLISSSPTTSMHAYSTTLERGWQSSALSSGFLPPVANWSEPYFIIRSDGICFPCPKGISGRESSSLSSAWHMVDTQYLFVEWNKSYNDERIFAVWIFAATKEKMVTWWRAWDVAREAPGERGQAQGKEVPPKGTRELERETDGRRKSREQAWEVLGKDNL